jgi:diphthine-ammonia ligase
MNIFISSMEDFASINVVYASYFGVSPPARACVSVDLPYPLRVMLDCVAYSEQKASDRQALHVQGLSYWAPANIGPYSQAIIVRTNVALVSPVPC